MLAVAGRAAALLTPRRFWVACAQRYHHVHAGRPGEGADRAIIVVAADAPRLRTLIREIKYHTLHVIHVMRISLVVRLQLA